MEKEKAARGCIIESPHFTTISLPELGEVISGMTPNYSSLLFLADFNMKQSAVMIKMLDG